VMSIGGDAAAAEERAESRGVRSSDRIDVPHVRRAGDGNGEFEVADVGECLAVEHGCLPPLLVPLVEQRELAQEDERLKSVQARPVADVLGAVAARLTVLAERLRAASRLRVVEDECPGVPHGSEILRGVEAEGRGGAHGAGTDAVSLGAVRLACVLEQLEAAAASELLERPNVRELTVEM